MALVTITEAARLAGIGRSSLYQTYIKKGRLTVQRDDAGKKRIETSELIRVFGELQSNNENDQKNVNATDKETSKDVQIKMLEQQLEQSRDNERWLKSQIESMNETMKLLEAPKQPPYPRLWWQFWK